MMKQNLRLFFLTLLCAVFSTAWGETSSLIFTAACGGSGTADDGVEWTVTSDQDESTFDSTKGIHYGTGSKAVSYLNLTTSDITGNITQIVVNASGASGTSAELNVTVGGSAFGNGQKLTSDATYYTFTGNATGDITVELSQTSAKRALYVKSIVVTYTSGSSTTVAAPTFSPVTSTSFYGSQTVTLSTTTDGATIYYTTNGDTPTPDENIRYRAPFTISETTTIKAIAAKEGMTTSAVSEATYTKLTPSISVANTNVSVTSAGGVGTINVIYGGIESQDLIVCDANGNTAMYDWIVAELNSDKNIDYLVDENTSPSSRTAYLKVYGHDAGANEIYSDLITITQAAPALDYATLPFEFDGNSNDISLTDGLSADGLDSYNSSPKLQFNTTGDYLILHFNEQPGTLTFDIKGNSFSGGTFKVQTSEDGTTFTDLETYTSLSATQSETFDELGENVRYIKWIYTTKSNGNVALGNIKLTRYVAKYTLNISSNDHATINVFYNEDYNPAIADGAQVPVGSSILVSVSANAGYQVDGITVTDGNNQMVAVEQEGISWTFTMPESNVTVSATVLLIPSTDKKYTKVTSTEELIPGTYLIVYEDGNRAFNGSLTTLDAENNFVAVTIDDNNRILGNDAVDAATFTIDVTNGTGTIKSASGYYIGQIDDTNGMASDANTHYENTISFDNEGNAFIVSSGAYLRYNSSSNQNRFRYYKSGSYLNQKAIQLYKQLVTYDISINPLATDGTYYYATVSNLGEGYWTVPAGVTVSTVVVNNEGNLTNPFEATAGQRIPGNGAYLVKATTSGSHSFVKSTNTETVSIGDNNMLYSTGEGNFTTVGPENVDCFFYKLARNSAGALNSVGFYWHNSDGSAFEYPTGHQAYLAVPQSLVHLTSSFTFDGTNGISEIVTSTDTQQIYTISGVRVNSSQLTKGLYIINGKKVIIK